MQTQYPDQEAAPKVSDTAVSSETSQDMRSRIEQIQAGLGALLFELERFADDYPDQAPIARCLKGVRTAQAFLASDDALADDDDEVTTVVDWKAFGQRLFKKRTAAKMSQKELAARVGKTSTMIRYIEKGRKAPGRKTLSLLLEIPELGLGTVDNAQKADRETNSNDDSVEPNAVLSRRYDPVQMLDKMREVLSSSGGQIEQTHLYIDPQSATDWMDICNAAAYVSAYRSSTAFDPFAKAIAEVSGTGPIEINALGCGDGRTEVMFVQHLINHLPRRANVSLNLIDISHTLLNVANKHARDTLRRVHVCAIHGNFHEVGRYQKNSSEKMSCRLFTLMGYTLINVQDEVRFFRDSLSGCEAGDLFLADIGTAYASPDRPDEIRRLDPSVRQSDEVRAPHVTWLGGPIRRYCKGMLDVRFSLELDTRCPVPGSYGLDFIATVKMSGGKPDRRFLMWRTRRYDPAKLAATLATVGWQPMKILAYGSDEGTQNLAMMLFRKQ